MQIQTSLFCALLALAVPTFASPTTKREIYPASSWNCGCSARKQSLVSIGFNAFDLAVAVQETGSALSGTSYSFGDDKQGSSLDAACFSMFKYNWYSIRTSCKQFAGMDASQWQAASILNSDDAAALTCMHEQLAKYPGDVWFIVQRDGAGYLGASMSETAKGYRDAVTNAATYLQSHMTDDWVRSSQIGAQ